MKNLELNIFIERLKEKEAKGYLVGGYVRDKIISEIENNPLEFKDRDYAVTGLTIKEFEELFPEAKKIGTESLIYENDIVKTEKTPVYLVQIDGEISEVALARSEIKIGEGHQGFAFVYDKDATIIDDLKRRDFTMNAMAIDLETSELIDPFGGRLHIKNKEIKGIFIEENIELDLGDNEIKMINNEFYLKKKDKIYSCKLPQDPLRGLRAGRFASKFGFAIEKDTLNALSILESEIKQLSTSRIYEETKKALVGKRPDLYLQTMQEAGLLKEFLPEISALEGFEQSPNKHPEGNVFEHTGQVTLAASILTKRLIPNVQSVLEKNVISAIFHDVGKSLTQTFNLERNIIQYIRHEEAGIPVVIDFLKRWNISNWKEHMETVTGKHMLMHNDFSNIKANKVASIFSGNIKKKQLNENEIEEFQKYFITKNGIKNAEDIDIYIKEVIANQNNIGQILKKVAIVFKPEINNRKIKYKEWREAKNNGKHLEFVNSKIMPESLLKKIYCYEKTKGVEELITNECFYIICAADTLGRLKNKEYIEEVFVDAAKIIKENNIDNQLEIEGYLDNWKFKYNLDEKYVTDFGNLLKNLAISKQYNLEKQFIVSSINGETLKELGKKPDDIAFAKFESKRNQEIKVLKGIQKSVKAEIKEELNKSKGLSK